MAVDQRARVVYQIEVDASSAVRQIGQISKNTDRLANGFERVQRRATQFGRTLRNALAGGALVLGIQRLTGGLGRLADSAENLQQRLSAVGGGPQGATVIFQELFDIAQRLSIPIDALGLSLQKFRVAIPNASVRELIESLEAVGQGLISSSASVQATNAVLLQLSQGFGAGALRGDEFKSVLENAPVLLRAWANAAGETEKSLKQLRDENFFTTQSFVDNRKAIQESIIAITGIRDPVATISRALTNVRNAITAAFFGQAGDTPANRFAEQLLRLSENVLPFTQGALSTLTVTFDLLATGISSTFEVLGRLVDLLGELFGQSSQANEQLGFIEKLFRVTLPSGIKNTQLALEALGKLIGVELASQFRNLEIRWNQITNELELAWLKFVEGLPAPLRRQLENTTRFFTQVLNFWIRNLELILTALNQIAGSSEQVSLGRVGDFSTFFRSSEENQQRITELTERRAKLEEDSANNRNQLERERLEIQNELFSKADAFRRSTLAATRATPGDTGVLDRPGTGRAPALEADAKAAAKAERERLKLAKERLAEEKEFARLLKEEADLLARIERNANGIRADFAERLKQQEEEIQLAQLRGAEQEQFNNLLEIERERRQLNLDLAQAVGDEDREAARLRLALFEQGVPTLLTNANALDAINRAGEASGGAFFDGFRAAADGVKDVFSDIFKNGLDEARSFSDSLRDILTNTVDAILDSLINTFVDQLAGGIQQGLQGAVGGGGGILGGGGGGGGGILGALFGGGGGGGFSLGAAGGPADAFNAGGGGGGFNLGSLASPLGFLAGGLAASIFDSKSSVRETSPLELDPLPDDFSGQPNFTVVNNGPPLAVDGVSRTNGDYQLIVSSAVNETRSVYERDLRRGYGGFAESLRNNTTADNSV